MLSSLFFQNYRSILTLKVDFSYGEGKAPNGYQKQEILPFIDAGNNHRLVPCLAFFGANASGKTNILNAFVVLKELLIRDGNLADLFDPNLLNRKFSETTFELEFFLDGDRFAYRITYSATAIAEEALVKNGKLIFAIQHLQPEFAPQILSSTYSREKLSEILRVECSNGEGPQTKPFLRCIGRGWPGLHSDLRNAFTYFETGLNVFSNDVLIPLPLSVQILASALNGDEVAALREITDVVRRLDIDIDAIDINRRELATDEPASNFVQIYPKTDVRHTFQITTAHKDAAGNSVLLDFIKHESAGTQRLAALIGLILHTLKTGGVFLVDELECSLHPLLMREIVMMFKKRRHNPKGAQLIFTTHNTDILDDSILRLSEIALVRKNTSNGTLVRRLVDAKREGEDVRNVTNFRKQYLAGFYSGVPHPAL